MFAAMLAALLATAPQAQPVWQVLDIHKEQKRLLAIDVASVPQAVKADSIVKARIFVKFDMPELSALITYWTIDCAKNLHQVSETSTFDKAGNMSPPDHDALPWEATPPDSLFDVVTLYVCKGQNLLPGKTMTGTAPIAAANAFLQQ